MCVCEREKLHEWSFVGNSSAFVCVCVYKKASTHHARLSAAGMCYCVSVLVNVNVRTCACYAHVYMSVIILFSELLLAYLLRVCHLFLCPVRWT